MRIQMKQTIALMAAASMAIQSVSGFSYSANAKSAESTTDLVTVYDTEHVVMQEGGFAKETTISDSSAVAVPEQDEVSEWMAFAGIQAAAYSVNQDAGFEETVLEAWKNYSATVDISKYKIKTTELKDRYFGLLNQNPRYFFVDNTYRYYYSGDYATEIVISYKYDKAQSDAMLLEYETEVRKVIADADETWTDFEKALYINEYLTQNVAYDTTYQKYSAYDVFVQKNAVCQGYVLAFQELASCLGLTSAYVSSEALCHTWNLVEINGSYYHIDSTWNDPVPDLQGRSGHSYFLKSSSYFNSAAGKHQASDWMFGKGLTASDAANTQYDSAAWSTVDCGFFYLNGSWYTIDKNKDGFVRYSCDGFNLNYMEKIFALSNKWMIPGTNSYYPKMERLASMNGEMYYSTPKNIYKIAPEQWSSELYYSLTPEQDSEGSIYGFSIDIDGTMKIDLGVAPDDFRTMLIGQIEPDRVIELPTPEEPTTTEEETTERRTTEQETTERKTTEKETTEQKTTEIKTTEQGTTERRTTEKETTERRTTEKETTERRTTERETTEQETAEGKTTEKETTEWETTERETTKIESTEETTGEEVTTEKVTTEKATTDNMTTEALTTEKVTKEEVTTEEITTEEKTTEEVTTKEVTTDEVTTEEVTTEEVTTEEKTTEEATTEGVTTEEITTEEITTEEITTEEVTEEEETTRGAVEPVDLSRFTATLEYGSVGYNKKAHTPQVTVKSPDGKLVKDVDYTITYTNNVNAGMAAVMIEGIRNYKGRIKKTFTITPAQNQLTAADSFTKTASAVKTQTLSLNAKAASGAASITYVSSDKNVKVTTSGVVAIPKNYAGRFKVYVTAKNDNYTQVKKTITVTVNKLANRLMVPSAAYQRIASGKKAQTISLGIKAVSGSAGIQYTSSNQAVTVRSGRVTIPKNFVGKVVIKVRAGSGAYQTVSKTITITVNPAVPKITGLKNTAKNTATVTWGKISYASAYELQYAARPDFSDAKTIRIPVSAVSKDMKKLKGKTKYYVRIRAYKTVGKTKFYSGWSEKKAVRIIK